MIYLDENIYIPNLLGIDSSLYSIEIVNNVTNDKITLDASNISSNELYYQFDLDVSGMSQNEYTIVLYDDSSQCLGKYLAQKGIMKAVRTSFEDDTQYIQFEEN